MNYNLYIIVDNSCTSYQPWLVMIVWLVVSIIFDVLFHTWDVILPIDELIFFKMVLHHQPDYHLSSHCLPTFTLW
jgi:uncharacterized membrane protein YjjP (DUF1212 family)